MSALLALTTDEDTDGATGTAQRREARKASRGLVDATNGVKATTNGDIPFPVMGGDLAQYAQKPLKDVPTEALTSCYLKAKDRPEKKYRGLAVSIEQLLEERRLADEANDFTKPHPALRDA